MINQLQLFLQLEEDAIDFEKEQKRLAEVHRKAWEEDVQEKRRLEKMTEAKDQLAEDIMTRRAAEFARLKVLKQSPLIWTEMCSPQAYRLDIL